MSIFMDQNSNMNQGQSSQAVNPKKLFVGNLSWNLTSDDLREIFGEFGTVEEAIVLTDKFSGRSKGFGFVTMSSDEEATAAVDGLNQKDVDGRAMVVNIAQPPKPRTEGDRGGHFERRSTGGAGGYNNNRGGDRGGYNSNRGPRRDY